MSDSRPPPEVAKFRDEFRQRGLGRHYQGWAHFAFTSGVSLAVIALAVSRLHAVRPVEGCMVPAAFLLANAAEYLGHKGAMHRRRWGLGRVYERHSLQHHRFFTHDAMEYESSQDFKMVLFPPVLLLFFLGGIATPLGALFFLLLSPNAGWLFVATGLGYYLTYEWLHFAYHLPAEHPLARVALLARLRRHHTAHHDPRRMGRYNFNITFPLCDRLFGTVWKPEAEPRPRPPEGT